MRRVIPFALTGMLALPAAAGDRLNLGYNAVEAAFTSQGTERTRLLTNADIGKGLQFGYHGLNETDNFNDGRYFGRHAITAGEKGGPVKFVSVIKTNGKGMIDAKSGLRVAKMPHGYGYADLTFDTHSTNMTLFYGLPFGKNSFELVQNAEFGNEKPSYYTEPQVNFSLGKHLAVFGRAEISGLRIDDAKYLAGIAVVFR
ncbi:MAG: hypothetical protein HY513_03785 [Candidatus Aenigmarchaeota archaeon]|nr:hypothetical protein [Candidatus Aenigmarchaeota archaeon]